MHVAEISFPFTNNIEIDIVSDLVNRLLAVWRMNGQVCNREWPITIAENVAFATVLIPEPISLEKEISNEKRNNRVYHRIYAGDRTTTKT